MALVYARKVDQQCLHLQKVVKHAGESEGASVAAFVQAGYLQLELALRLYVLELNPNADLEFITPASLAHAREQTQAAELAEMEDLAKRPQSWLQRFLRQLQTLRGGEEPGKLKGSIFQIEPDDAPNLIAVQDVSTQPQEPNLQDLQATLADFRRMVERQRSVRAEY